MKTIAFLVAIAASLAAKADYWMTFCMTPGGQQYAQVGYVKPDADGFVTIKAGPLTITVCKPQGGIRGCRAKCRDKDRVL